MTNADRFTRQEHKWVTVINPTNRRVLLQACDNCGVVKSENTVIQDCSQPHARHLISGAISKHMLMVG